MPRAARVLAGPRAEPVAVEDLDRDYRAVLRLLGLSAAHRAALLRRGLDKATIDGRLVRILLAPEAG